MTATVMQLSGSGAMPITAAIEIGTDDQGARYVSQFVINDQYGDEVARIPPEIIRFVDVAPLVSFKQPSLTFDLPQQIQILITLSFAPCTTVTVSMAAADDGTHDFLADLDDGLCVACGMPYEEPEAHHTPKKGRQ